MKNNIIVTNADKKKELEVLNVLWKKGLSVCSIKFAEKLLKNFPGEFKALIILGLSQTGIDRHSDAIKSINEAIQRASPAQKYQAFVTMAFIYYNMGSFSIAETWFNKALSIKPLRAIDLIFLGDCLIKTGNFSEAIIFLEQAICAKTSSDADANFHLGIAYRAEGKYDMALEFFQKTIEIDDIYIAAKDAIEDIENILSGGGDSPRS